MGLFMKRSTNKIWRNKLEDFITDLYFEQRKNCKEIVEIIKKEKNINTNRESVRRYISEKILHEKNRKNM